MAVSVRGMASPWGHLLEETLIFLLMPPKMPPDAPGCQW